MKEFMQYLKNLYSNAMASPTGRLIRRFAVIAILAVVASLGTKLVYTPDQFIDSLLALTRQDLTIAIKTGLGAGLLAFLDKLQREWRNL